MGPLRFEEGEREKLIAGLKTNHFKPTRFRFIEDHMGLRPKCRHVLMGTSGIGKTTLTRAILVDYATNHKVLLYSSEEDEIQTKTMLALNNVPDEVIKNIVFFSEKTMLKELALGADDHKEWARHIEVQIRNEACEILFFDNITTSSFYDGRTYPQQEAFLRSLESVYVDTEVACFLVAHTKKGVKNDQTAFIEPDDVKGPTALTNKAEIMYVYQLIRGKTNGTSSPTAGIVKVIKCRFLGNIGSKYMLKFNHDTSEYTGDRAIGSLELGELYKNREKNER